MLYRERTDWVFIIIHVFFTTNYSHVHHYFIYIIVNIIFAMLRHSQILNIIIISYENLYSPNKHGRRVDSTNTVRTTQLQSRQETIEARFKFRHTFGP